MRTIVSVIGIVAVFAAVVMYGGEYVGAWDALEPPGRTSVAPGEDDEPTPTTTESAPATTAAAEPPAPKLTAAEKQWLEQANALCRRSAEEVAALPRPTSEKDAKVVFAQAIELNAFYNDEFAALGAPPGGEAPFAALLGLFEREEELLAKMQRALRENKLNHFNNLSDQVIPLTLDEDDLLYELGAEDCTVELLPDLSY